jgi:hypothetical protein
MRLKISSSPFNEVVSLGSYCVVRWQISRSIIRNIKPDVSDRDLSDHILGRKEGLLTTGTHVFDWLVSPSAGVLRLLNTDFDAAFLRENLRVTADGKNVCDTTTGFLFPHNFSHPGEIYTEQIIDQEFPEQKHKMDHLILDQIQVNPE